MSVHVEKKTTAIVQGVPLKRMACVNSAFIKGPILSKEEFAARYTTNPDHCCKKCVKIAGLK